MKQFNTVITVTLPDSNKVEIKVSLFEPNTVFNCPICDFIGEEEKISLLSLSDHLARHYVENNRAEKIEAAVREEKKKMPVITPEDITLYDNYVRSDGNKYDNRDDWVNMTGERHPQVQYPQVQYELSEDDMLKLAIEESLREAEIEKTIAETATADNKALDAVTGASASVFITENNAANVQGGASEATYQPRRKKVSDTTQ